MSAEGEPAGGGGARRLAGAVVGLSTALVIVGATIALFFNPAWVSFEQVRAEVTAWTGWTPAQVDAVSRDVVAEVWLGPGTFAQEVAGAPVFDERERSHMADVRRVVLGFYALVGLGLAALVVGGLAWRRSRWFWRAVSWGAAGLAVGAAVVGSAFFVFFDTAFTLFHEIFFAAGTWTFDPATDRLVQLFPYRFWTETSIAVAIVGLVLTTAVWALARRRAGPGHGARIASGALTPGGEEGR